MKNLIIIIVVLSLLMPLISSTAMAQDIPQSQIIWVTEVKVAPSKAQQFEAELMNWLNLLKKNKYSLPINVVVGMDSAYRFSSGRPNFSAIEKANAEYGAIIQTKEGQDLFLRFADLANGQDVLLVRSRPDLSYAPDNPRLATEERLYRHREYLYIKPGSETIMEEILKKFIALATKHKIRTPLWVGTAMTGVNLPFYAVVSGGASASDFWTQREKEIEKMGEQHQSLVSEVGTILRDYTVLDVTPRPDLSYTPEQ